MAIASGPAGPVLHGRTSFHGHFWSCACADNESRLGAALSTCRAYRPFHVGVASKLATAIYVAMVTPILYDNSYSLNDSNLKYESCRPYG